MTPREHDAAIEIAKAQAAGTIPAIAQSLIELVDDLRRQADDQEAELKRLYLIEEEARCVFQYHRSGRFGTDDFNEAWDADDMIEKLESLGKALKQ
ncbi:hypothetical protein [Sphingobium yanoikuyae]|jgi:hypothetical protein|uniref:Uncharacterized protein n=1 Tax=Sphingobium yanoikuyae TaxID=13690 RepID=A0A9X7UE19_SPHYA|nr:hypothetical protein [Sphingobium yanoikuyae]QNG44670.1 hypothetical protein H3V42_22890 [Sphingobium yanoikuyae]